MKKGSRSNSHSERSHGISYQNSGSNVSRDQFKSLNPHRDDVEMNADYYGDDSDKGETIVTNYFYLNK